MIPITQLCSTSNALKSPVFTQDNLQLSTASSTPLSPVLSSSPFVLTYTSDYAYASYLEQDRLSKSFELLGSLGEGGFGQVF